ncbi:MAG TPA: hypothetical protein VLD39_11320, partial [Gammaproteobacteria bacterium]|nr:hypothetical protein [Gammaproteobacteria bacterium]
MIEPSSSKLAAYAAVMPEALTVLRLPGPVAETEFRRARLVEQLAARCPAVESVAVRFVHLVHLGRALSTDERALLNALLSYGDALGQSPGGQEITVVPRIGTISPWASKATDIARICGLPVQRLERGRVYSVGAGERLDRAALQGLATLLHDRMMETAI